VAILTRIASVALIALLLGGQVYARLRAGAVVQQGGDPTVGVLPAYNDAYANWKNAGLQPIGGIPSRSTQCGSTVSPSGLTPPTTGDDASLINTAITACTAGQVVQLDAGTFQLDNSEQVLLGKGVTLRGSGTCNNGSSPYCATVINIRNGSIAWTGGKCGVNTGSEVTCGFEASIQVQPAAQSNQFDYGWASCGHLTSARNCGAAEVMADVAQGQSVIQVSSTTHFSVGAWVMIDEASGATWQTDPVGPNLYGQVWASPDWPTSSGSPSTGRVQWACHGTGGPNGACDGTEDYNSGQYPYNGPRVIQAMRDRATTEIHLISAVGPGPCPGSSCTITFDDPVMVAFRQSGAGTFTGSISGTTLTTSGDPCALTSGQIVSDATNTIVDGTYVTAVNSCSGGVGSYTVTTSQTVASETIIYGAHQAHVYWPAHQNGTAMPFITQAGVENLTVNKSDGGGVNFLFCGYCWAKNVEVVNWVAGAFNFNDSARGQVDTSFANNCADSVNNGAEYPIGIQDSSTEIYVINSITIQCGKGMVGKTGAGSVVAYSYMDQTMYDSFSGIGDYWLDMGVNGSHYEGTNHYLFEGNWGNNLDNDDTHGNAVYHTYFRNWGTGLRTPFTDPSIPASVNDATGVGHSCGSTGPGSCSPNAPFVLRVAGPMMHNYWFAYVGNVLGTSGTTTGNGWTYSGNYTSSKHIWMPGWNSDAGHQTASDPNITAGPTSTYIFTHGNYDYVHGSIFDWHAGYSQMLPNSFYLSGAPSFFSVGAFCTYSWPWVTPVSATTIQTNSCGGSGLPALARFNAGTPFVQP
jgi:hypothetical protein